MKRIISIIIGLISVLGLQAQVTECMRIYTDKDNYLAGEDLWIKVCVTDSAEAPFSKVAYVEISDMRQVYAQGKIALRMEPDGGVSNSRKLYIRVPISLRLIPVT